MRFRHALAAIITVGTVFVGAGGQALAAPAGQAGLAPAASTVHYKIERLTSHREGSGTDATVKVKLHGMGGSSAWLTLDEEGWDDHQSAYADVAEFDLPDLGSIRHIDVNFDHAGKKADWYVDWIRVMSPGQSAFFQVHRWFVEPGTVRFTIPTGAVPRKYAISILTGNVLDAGTDATVEIRLHGSIRTSPWIYMGSWDDNHERARLDQYWDEVYDVGTIDHVELRFDHSGKGADWYLDNIYISLDHPDNPLIGKFNYHGWLTTATTITLDNKV